MATNGSLTYLYQLQKATYSSLAAQNFKIGVVDCDDAQLTSAQVATLRSSGKTLFSYLSIGEAEEYRDYWIKGNWGTQKPGFVLAENQDWEGNYRVKFWDTSWQKIMVDKAVLLAKTGYSGMYLDIVDAYQQEDVIAAYKGSSTALRQEMINFVVKLSAAVKAVNPNFKVIPQNAVGLLALNEDNPAIANKAYLKAIDGVGKEDTWTNGNAKVEWTQGDLEFLKLATANGKFVLSIDYPTTEALQQAYIDKAIGAGFIPFIGNRALDGRIDDTNYLVGTKLPTATQDKATDTATLPSVTPKQVAGSDVTDLLYGSANKEVMDGKLGNDKLYGGANNDTLSGGGGNDALYGQAGTDSLSGGDGLDTLDGGAGNDVLNGGAGKDAFYFSAGCGQDVITRFDNPGKSAGDIIYISKAIYTNTAAILSHVSYANGDAVIDLGSNGKITLDDFAPNTLTVHDFAVF